MDNIQVNGQRKWGPPKDWIGPPPPHGTEIFIKNLPEDIFEFDLYVLFSILGPIYEVRLPIHWSGINRGYAFIRYTTVADADKAIKCFDMYEIREDRPLYVKRSVDNTRLFLSAVPKEKTAKDIKDDLLTIVENIKKVYVYPTLENRNFYRGYAFIEFETHRDAAIAKRLLTPDVCMSLFEKKCVAAWANPLPFLDESVLNKLNVLFLRNIPREIRSQQLKKALEVILGSSELYKLKRVNDFAFLTFKDHESAKQALEILKLMPLLIEKFQMQVEWAIPKDMVDATDKENVPMNSSRKSISRQRPNKNVSPQKLREIPLPAINSYKPESTPYGRNPFQIFEDINKNKLDYKFSPWAYPPEEQNLDRVSPQSIGFFQRSFGSSLDYSRPQTPTETSSSSCSSLQMSWPLQNIYLN